MATAANTRSVPRISGITQAANSPAGNQKPVTQIDSAKKRIAARMAVVCDAKLSHGACRLYVLLDDYAGMKGQCWPKQQTLADQMSVSRRTIIGWLEELVTAGYVDDTRRKRASVYALDWAAVDVQEPAHLDEPEMCKNLHVRCEESCTSNEVLSLYEPVFKEPGVKSGPCPRCNDLGWIAYTSYLREGKKTTAIVCNCRSSAEEAGGWGHGEKLLRKNLLVKVE